MKVLVIDCNTNNLLSVTRAFERANADVLLCESPQQARGDFTHIVLPGIGRFSSGMANLRALGWDAFLRSYSSEYGMPTLGICLGMQMLAAVGTEGGTTEGLGLIPGTVKKLVPEVQSERIPHVGWNEVYQNSDCALLDGIPDLTDFYFVHSYHFATDRDANRVGTTPYCGGFTSIVQHRNVFGVQFHPEKSGRPGLRLIENFLRLDSRC